MMHYFMKKNGGFYSVWQQEDSMPEKPGARELSKDHAQLLLQGCEIVKTSCLDEYPEFCAAVGIKPDVIPERIDGWSIKFRMDDGTDSWAAGYRTKYAVHQNRDDAWLTYRNAEPISDGVAMSQSIVQVEWYRDKNGIESITEVAA